jgi:hypothetical protein
MPLPHLTVDQLIKLGSALGALTGFFGFLRLTYKRMLKPICKKISEAIDNEIAFRGQIRDALTDYEKVKPALKDLWEMFDWYQKIKLYADVKLVPRAKAAAAGEDTVIKN